MTRTERLLNLMQILRQYRYPVKGIELSDKLDVSIRTLYRDIDTLRSQGAEIEGEPGIGYLLKPGFFLPPLMFSQDEIEVLMLGLHWVKTFGDKSLSSPSEAVLSKISEVLPKSITKKSNYNHLRVGPPPLDKMRNEDLSGLRKAIQNSSIIEFNYSFRKQKKLTNFTVWPFSIGYFPTNRILVAWCQEKQDFLYFKTSKIKDLIIQNKKYPERSEVLFRTWHSIVLKELKKDSM